MTPEAFEALLNSVYAAAEDPRLWEGVLAELTRHISGAGAGLHAGAINGSGFSFGTTYRVDPEGLAEYARYYYSVNPLNAALSRIPAGSAVPDHQLVAPRDLERGEIFDHMRRFDFRGSVTLVIERNSHYESCLGVIRTLRSDVFTDEQVAFVQRLSPHIRRAIGLNRRMAALQAERETFESACDRLTIAVFLLDGAGVISYANIVALRLLEKRDGLESIRGRLFANNTGAQNSLAEAIRAAIAEKRARGGCVCVPREHPARSLFVKLMPIAQGGEFWPNGYRARAILFVSDPDVPAGDAFDGVTDAYGLTPSEKKLLGELVAGSSLQEAAEALAITRVTSRNRLARIMAKTDTHRQSELVQLMLRSSIPAR